MSSSPSIEVGAPRSLSHSVCCCEIGEVWIEDNTDNQSSAPEPPSVFAGPEETKPSGYLGLGCRVGKAISRSVVTILEKSRRRLPKGALSFVSDLSFGLQLIALATGMALAWLVANAARDTFAALVAAYEHLLRMAASGEFADLHRISAALKQLGEPAALAEAQALAAKSPIKTGVDASIKMGEAKGAEKFTALFDELLAFYSRVDTRYGRRNFIARCSNDATPA